MQCAIDGCTESTSGKSKYCKLHKKIARDRWLAMIADKRQPAGAAPEKPAPPPRPAAKAPVKAAAPSKGKKRGPAMATLYKCTEPQYYCLRHLDRYPEGLPYDAVKHHGVMVLSSLTAARKQYVKKTGTLYQITDRGRLALQHARWR